ncbi:hypothetical protein E4U09_003618 [Claviceps aff. purpurea]|uniref:Uncharacterized protein n=1 Tax=Claviceps aff. purpurea TaxID=1967640 RepID=A0A9P7QGF2_9HYPO|nr:hypothetical protein E4U09_003618 [Claviceps aff. purpurea]
MADCKDQSDIDNSCTGNSGDDFLADTFGRISLAENPATQPGTSEAAIQHDGSKDIERWEQMKQRALPLLVRAVLQRRQIHRELAAADGKDSNQEHLLSLARERCASHFPLPCSDEAWSQLLADFPEEEVALRQLGQADTGQKR